MRVILDLHQDGRGRWAAEAYDLTDGPQRSTILPCASADLAVAGVDPTVHRGKRLLFDAAQLTSFADHLLDPDVPTLLALMYQPQDRVRMLDFERRIEPRYSEYYAELGVRYSGVFDVSGLAGDHLGEILAFDRSLAAAKRFVDEYEAAPDIRQIEDECRALQRRDRRRHVLWLSR